MSGKRGCSCSVSVSLPALVLGTLVALKLTGVIGWSWWLVLLPLVLWVAWALASAVAGLLDGLRRRD